MCIYTEGIPGAREYTCSNCLAPTSSVNSISIRIQPPYPSLSINQDTTSVSVNIYQSGCNLCIRQYLSIRMQPLYSSVSINRDTTSVFVSIYQLRYNLYIRQYLSLKIQPLYSSVSINRDTARSRTQCSTIMP